MESRAALAGALFAALVFAVLVGLMLGPIAGVLGFAFIALVAFAPALRRRR